MSFAWIFALIVGAFILALAIFAVIKFTGVENTTQSAETSKGIGVLLNPLEISFESGKTTSFSLSTESRIYATCNSLGDFGTERISVSQKVYGKWSDTDIGVSFVNKYIFSRKPIEGKNFYVFSKPYNLPFKVADLIYLTSEKDNYCFIDAPRNIEEEISFLNPSIKNLYYQSCPENSINVCFRPGQNCDVSVNYNSKIISKDGVSFYFSDDSLMYAGIFSDSDTYECQIERLMKRAKELSFLYADKETFLSQKVGCQVNLKTDLFALGNLEENYEDLLDLRIISSFAGDLDGKNFGACKLW